MLASKPVLCDCLPDTGCIDPEQIKKKITSKTKAIIITHLWGHPCELNEIMDFRGLELPDDDILDNWMCMYPFQRLVVSANGTVLACPGAHNEEDDVSLGKIPGGIKKRVKVNGTNKEIEYPEGTLMDAWNSEKLIRVRELHATSRRKEIWACKHCRHGAKKYGVKWLPDEWDMGKMEWKTQRRFRNN